MWQRFVAIVLSAGVLSAGSACRSGAPDSRPLIVQPGAPGESSEVISAAEASDLSRVRHTQADVRFMQGMIAHHAQALEMTSLLPARTASDGMKKLALRIEASQADEIKMMQEWLTIRGQPLPDPHAHHAPGTMMPGMLSAAEMTRLAGAEGPAFDRLFLESMIRHHEGALIMVEELFSTPGAGQESDVFAFASDVDADQRMEIDRMAAMLASLKETRR